MARTSTRHAAANAEAEAKLQQERDRQAAIDSVVVGCMREFVSAQHDAAEAKELFDKATVKVGNVKVAVMLKLADAANRGKWTTAAIKMALDAAMLVWAGNETVNGKTPEERLTTPTARRLRSEFNLAMLPEVRGKAAQIIEASQKAWDEEAAARAADPKADMPLHAKFWDRPAELQLFNLRAAKETKETRGRGAEKVERTIPGVVLTERAAMVAAITPDPVEPMVAAANAVNKIATAIDALAEEYKSTELLAPVRALLLATATAAALVGRLNAIEDASVTPAPAPAPAPVTPAPAPAPAAAEPISGAADDTLAREFAEFQAFRAMKAKNS